MKRTMVSLIVLLIAAAIPATASTFVFMTLPEMVAEADAIVFGEVVQRDVSWTESGRLITANNRVNVSEVWVGQAGKEVSVRTIGGQVGDFMVEAHGFPQLHEGEKVVLFLRKDEETGQHEILGYQLGHYRFVERLDGKQLAVPQTEEGIRFVEDDQFTEKAMQSSDFHEFKAGILAIARGLGRGGVNLSK